MDEDMEKEIKTRFTYHPPKTGQLSKYERLRAEAANFATSIVLSCPASREQSLALTKIEEAVMWANAAIARRE